MSPVKAATRQLLEVGVSENTTFRRRLPPPDIVSVVATVAAAGADLSVGAGQVVHHEHLALAAMAVEDDDPSLVEVDAQALGEVDLGLGTPVHADEALCHAGVPDGEVESQPWPMGQAATAAGTATRPKATACRRR